MMSNREQARDALATADQNAGNSQVGDYSAAMALIGIGYAILDAADAIRDAAGGAR